MHFVCVCEHRVWCTLHSALWPTHTCTRAIEKYMYEKRAKEAVEEGRLSGKYTPGVCVCAFACDCACVVVGVVVVVVVVVGVVVVVAVVVVLVLVVVAVVVVVVVVTSGFCAYMCL